MNPLYDLHGNPLSPVDSAEERAYLNRIEKFEKEVANEEWKQRHPFLSWCGGQCWDTLKSAVGTIVGFITIITAIYGFSRWAGWPNLASMADVEHSVNQLRTEVRNYFTNLQRMSWVSRVEILQNRLVDLTSQRQEFEDAIAIHTREMERSPENERIDIQRRIRTLRDQVTRLQREEDVALKERERYSKLLLETAPDRMILEQGDGKQGRN